jgi:hypothetical protein
MAGYRARRAGDAPAALAAISGREVMGKVVPIS